VGTSLEQSRKSIISDTMKDPTYCLEALIMMDEKLYAND